MRDRMFPREARQLTLILVPNLLSVSKDIRANCLVLLIPIFGIEIL
jgi:hypothetical protein